LEIELGGKVCQTDDTPPNDEDDDADEGKQQESEGHMNSMELASFTTSSWSY
jgi:hypothetical protein